MYFTSTAMIANERNAKGTQLANFGRTGKIALGLHLLSWYMQVTEGVFTHDATLIPPPPPPLPTPPFLPSPVSPPPSQPPLLHVDPPRTRHLRGYQASPPRLGVAGLLCGSALRVLRGYARATQPTLELEHGPEPEPEPPSHYHTVTYSSPPHHRRPVVCRHAAGPETGGCGAGECYTSPDVRRRWDLRLLLPVLTCTIRRSAGAGRSWGCAYTGTVGGDGGGGGGAARCSGAGLRHVASSDMPGGYGQARPQGHRWAGTR